MHRSALALLPLALLLACPAASDDDDAVGPVDKRVAIPAAPAEGEGLQIVMNEWVVPAGEEMMWCYVSSWRPEVDTFVNAFEGFQAAEGHHLVALGAQVPFQAGYEFDCTEIESMASLAPLVLPEPGAESTLPEGFAVKVAAGESVIIQSHYINYGTEDMLVRDVVHLGLADPSEPLTEASYIILNHAQLDLSPGDNDAEVTCSLPGQDDYNVVSLLGHMHEHGTAMDVRTQAKGGDWAQIYDVPQWSPEFRDLPPTLTWAPDEALSLAGGDRLSVRCSYDNNTDGNIRFPQEMCTSVLMYYPADTRGMIVCDEDDGAPQ